MPVSLPTLIKLPMLDFSAEEADIGETCEFESGEDRRNPIYRSVPTTVGVRWPMSQSEFDAFDAWYEDNLLAGSLTFNLPVMQQGGQATALEEAMFLAPPECTYVHSGSWEISAQCVIGVTFGDQFDDGVCINETFTSGISSYEVISGTDSGFSNFATGSYGQGLRMTAGAGPSGSTIKRSFAARDVFSVRFKFRVEALNSDDAGLIYLYAGGVVEFYFEPRRELFFSGGIGNPVVKVGAAFSEVGAGSAALDEDEWYQFDLTISASSELVITRLSDSAVISTTTIGSRPDGIEGVDSLRFLFDEGGSTMSTSSYADIHICGAEA